MPLLDRLFTLFGRATPDARERILERIPTASIDSPRLFLIFKRL
jgi:hypothetical protein